jgi:hypothetical protein
VQEIILIKEENHQLIGAASDYFSAIKWLVENGWLTKETEVGWITMQSMYGEDWIGKLLSFENETAFMAECPCPIILETIEVYSAE